MRKQRLMRRFTERAKAVADGKVTQAEVEALQAKIDAAQSET